MPIYSCSICSYTGFVTRDDAYDSVKPTSQTPIELYVDLHLFSAARPAAADDDDFVDFSHDNIFFINIFVL